MDDKTLLEAIDYIIHQYTEQFSNLFIDDSSINKYTHWLYLKEQVIKSRVWTDIKLSEFIPSDSDYKDSLEDTIRSQMQKHTVAVYMKPHTLEKLNKYMLNENKTASEVIEMWSVNHD